MPARKSRKVSNRTRPALFETLERRTLLSAAINGLFQATGSNVLEYKQADGSSVRISLHGNVTAEFIFARVPEASFQTIIRNHVPAGSEDDGVDLFSIYVLNADINSVIAIAQVPDPDADARFMDPFGGSAGSLSIFNATLGDVETVELGPGAVYIGARTFGFEAEELNDRPIITPTDGRRIFGLRPSSAGQMFAGLEMAPGVSLGKFMVGGTITGLVDIPGNMRLFYAGTILTGDAQGLGAGSASTITSNFYVGGDLEQLVSGSSIGTALTLETEELEDIIYKSGTQIRVDGRVGWIRTLDSFLGSVLVNNSPGATGLGIAQTELEFSGPTLNALSNESYFDPDFFGDAASLGTKAREPGFNNDTFDTAQYLGTLFSTDLDSREAIQIRGFLYPQWGDSVDYYAVALMAGQTAQVQLLNTFSGIGIFDPDGRLIATDYSDVNPTGRWNQPFRFTADRPGAYRIAIASRGDVNFNGVADDGETVSNINPDFYELRIQRTADIALGGLIADVHIATTDTGSTGITVTRGDIGAVRAGILGEGTIFSTSAPWSALAGNLRSIEAVSIGILRSDPALTLVGLGPDLLVPRGSIGLIRTTGLDQGNSILMVNQSFVSVFDDLSLVDPAQAVGVDIQLVDSGAVLASNLLANRGIGTIRAARVGITLTEPGVWMVNVDNRGDDGFIDLIDVNEDLGTLRTGGPAISTGDNGNVRYMRVGGLTFRDLFFGGGLPEPTTFQPGETVRLTDDNGTAVALAPVPTPPQIDPNTGFPTGQVDGPGTLRVLTYPVRDKGGVVIMRVEALPGVDGEGNTVGRGVEIISGARGRGGSVEIGEIVVLSPGTGQSFNPVTRTFTDLLDGQPSDVLLRGPSLIDVWSVEVRDPVSNEFTGLTQFTNRTAGEIVNITAAHIGEIAAETVGLAKSGTGAAVHGINVLLNGYPFNQQRNLIAAVGTPLGHIPLIVSRRGVGNVFAQGTIGTVVANSDGRKNQSGVHEGINGPILAVQTTAFDPLAGNIIDVRIGEGILPSGSGNVSFAGLYADGMIDRVRNTGLGSDIRGDIVARGQTVQVTQVNPDTQAIESSPAFIIGDILLTDGMIIDAEVLTVSEFSMSSELVNNLVIPQSQFPDNINNPTFDIRSIRLTGIGGIIGSFIAAEDVGLIRIDGGFGVISSSIDTLGDGTFDGIITDGYGVRSSSIGSGANVNNIIARGTGKRIDTRFYTPTARYSEKMSFDPYSGHLLDGSNDLHKFLGTTALNPKRVGYSDAGVIEDTQIVGSRTLRLIDAHRIIGRDVFVTDPNSGRRTRIPSGAVAYPMRVSFGNSIGTIRTRDVVDGLTVTGGSIDLFAPGNDAHYTNINVTGRINTIQSGGALRGTSSIKARGSDGTIGTLSTRRSLFAVVEASVDVGSINVGTYLGSPRILVGRHLDTLNVRNSILSGADVTVRGRLGSLVIGEDHEAGATVRADEIGTQQIGGQVLGDIIIT